MRYSSYALRKRRFDQAVADANAAVVKREAARGRLAYWAKVDPAFLYGPALVGYWREEGWEGYDNRSMRKAKQVYGVLRFQEQPLPTNKSWPVSY